MFESAFEVSPRKVVIIVEVDEHVKQGLDVVTPRFIVSPAGVERGEHEVSREVGQVLLGHVLCFPLNAFGQVELTETKIDQIDFRWVLKADQNIL